MKDLFLIVIFLFSLNITAQKPCEFSVNVKDSIGIYKETKSAIVHEFIFGNTSKYVFFALALTDEMPSLTVQILQKSKDFLKANCFDVNSKIFLQLNNGKIITLLHIDQESCGTLIRDDKGFDNRILTGTFMFLKGSMEELKNSPVNMMRIKYLTDMEDYVVKKEFQSELNNHVYEPETFFMNNLHCVE